MLRQAIAFVSHDMAHKEVGHIFYEYMSLSEQYLIINKLIDQYSADFVIILYNDGEPITSI